MKTERTFRIAPAIVRLLQRERLVARDITEGYLSHSPGRLHVVRVEPDGCTVLLLTAAEGRWAEDRAKVSAAQANALLGVCQGRITFRRSVVRVGALEACLDRFDGLDLLSVQFDDPGNASAFTIPAWFGPEVTEDPAYQKPSLAADGNPEAEEVPVSNASIIAFLDGQQMTGALSRRTEVLVGEESEDRDVAGNASSGLRLPVAAGAPDERLTGVLAGLSDALEGTAGASAENRRAPFLVPLARRST